MLQSEQTVEFMPWKDTYSGLDANSGPMTPGQYKIPKMA